MSYLVSQSKTFFTNKAKNRVLGRYAPAGCGIMVNVSNLFRNAQFLQLPGGLSAQPKAKLLGVALLVGYVKVDSILRNMVGYLIPPLEPRICGSAPAGGVDDCALGAIVWKCGPKMGWLCLLFKANKAPNGLARGWY